MAHVGVDLFEFSGKQYIACVDKWSGFPVYNILNSVTFRAVIAILEDRFNVLGWPTHLRSDGGPQFLGPFNAWCKENNIEHEQSSPYNPRGNGLVESAVKNVKHLLQKCSITRESAGKALGGMCLAVRVIVWLSFYLKEDRKLVCLCLIRNMICMISLQLNRQKTHLLPRVQITSIKIKKISSSSLPVRKW